MASFWLSITKATTIFVHIEMTFCSSNDMCIVFENKLTYDNLHKWQHCEYTNLHGILRHPETLDLVTIPWCHKTCIGISET